MGLEELVVPAAAGTELAELLRRRLPQRCLRHRPAFLEANPYYTPEEIGFALCLYADGTGIAVQEDERLPTGSPFRERVEFRWNDLGGSAPDLPDAPPDRLQEWCDLLFEQRINPRLAAPFLDRMQNVPLAWTGGSERTLRSLARAICLTEPDLFDVKEPVTALYEATTEYGHGGFVHLERIHPKSWPTQNDGSIEQITSLRLQRLGTLIFRANPFVGLRWVDLSGAEGDRNVACTAARISVYAEPPTAHEKAEAFLLLTDWLDENLTDSDERAQVGLPPLI